MKFYMNFRANSFYAKTAIFGADDVAWIILAGAFLVKVRALLEMGFELGLGHGCT